MKINLSVIVVSLFILSICNAQNSIGKDLKIKKMMETDKKKKTHNLELKKGELFVVAIADQKKIKKHYYKSILIL